jgi:glycosyltransferase involved in cell wall biosynthesis
MVQKVYPKVSVITVCYNAESLIERTIQSVISQTYSNIEFVVIDGKSKDGTTEIIERYRDKIGYYVSEPDKSLYDAMNKGLKAAAGDYVWYMNAGDKIYDPTTLEKIMDAAAGKDFIYGDVVRTDEEGNQRGWHKKIPAPENLSPKSFLNGMVICHQSMIVKREIAPEFSLLWRLANDIDWTIRVLKKAKSHQYVPVPFCYFLEGGLSANNRWRAVKERFTVTSNHFGVLPVLVEQVKIGFQVLRKGSIS